MLITRFKTEDNFAIVFCFLIFFIPPFVYNSGLLDPTQMPHIITGLSLVLLISFYFLQNKINQNYCLGIIDFFWISYIVLFSLNINYCKDISIAIFELGKLFFAYFLFIFFQYFVKNCKSYSAISLSLSFVCVYELTVVILQKYIGLDIYGSSSDLFGTMTHANVLSECMVFAFPLTLLGILLNTKAAKIISVFGFICSLILIVTLNTRSIWVSFITGCMVLCFVFIKKGVYKQLFVWLGKNVLIFTIATGFTLLLLTIFIFHDFNQLTHHIQTLLHFDSNGRSIIWSSTIHIIKEHFWFGVGAGNFRFYLPKTIGAFIQRPHNDYLWILSEAGVFGLLAFIGICFFTIKKILQNIKNLTGEKLIVNYTVLFGLITYLVDSFFAFPKERPYNLVFFAFFVAAPFALSPSPKIAKIKFKVLAPIIICISIFFLVFNCFRYDGERTLKSVLSSPDLTPQGRLTKLQSIKPWAYKVDPVTIPIKHYEGMAQLGLGNVLMAKECFLDAYKAYPFQPDVLLNLGTAYELTGERENAKLYYQKAIDVEPGDSRPKVNLAVVEYKEGNFMKSAGILKTIDTNDVKLDNQSYAQYSILKNSLRKYGTP